MQLHCVSTKVPQLNRLHLQLKPRKEIKITYPQKCEINKAQRDTIRHDLAER